MPIDIRCPSCDATFPVIEAGRAGSVQCPYCDEEFDTTLDRSAEAKPAAKAAAAHAAKAAKSAAAKKGSGSTARPAARRRRDDEDDDDRGKPRNASGGSPVMVLVVAGLGLFFVIGALGLTAYLILSPSSDKDKDTATTTNNSGGNQPQPNKGNPPPKNEPPRKNNPPRDNTPKDNPSPRPDITPKEKPQPKVDTFTLRPVAGTPVRIIPTVIDESPTTVSLPGKVANVQVGGGGRFLVMHFPDDHKLCVFDVSQAKVVAQRSTDADDTLFAAGLNKLAVLTPSRRTLNVFSLPDLKSEGGGTPPDNAAVVAMGSGTNGPLFVAGRGEVSLFDLAALQPVEGSSKFGLRVPLGPNAQARAAANGRLFTVTNAGGRLGPSDVLTESGGKWVESRLMVFPPLPGPDGDTVYGPGQVFGPDGMPLGPKVGGGIGKGVWFVPAAQGNYFLRLSEKKEGIGAKAKQSLVATVHANLDPNKEVASLGELPEADGLIDWRLGTPQALDRFVFLVPGAEVLAIIPPAAKDKIILRRVELK